MAAPDPVRGSARAYKYPIAYALLGAGMLCRDEDGGFVFPYDAVNVNFTLTAAAA